MRSVGFSQFLVPSSVFHESMNFAGFCKASRQMVE